MLSHIPRSSRIFIGLLIITLLLTYIAMTLSLNIPRYSFHPDPVVARDSFPQHPDRAAAANTKDWQQYRDPVYALTFSYPKDWKVSASADKNNVYNITLDNPKTPNDFHFYVSKSGYQGIDTALKKPYTVGSMQGYIASPNFVAVKTGEYYYTFDGSSNVNDDADFASIMDSVKFQ